MPSPPDFGEGTAIIDKGDDSILVDVEVADLPEQRAYGLMYRRELPPDYGMMFLFFESVRSPFYMKNTYVPLSIAFFDGQGTIIDIQDMQPCTKDPCPLYAPKGEYRGALEVSQGAFEDWGVEVGHSIRLAR